jgi:hypothetical protein
MKFSLCHAFLILFLISSFSTLSAQEKTFRVGVGTSLSLLAEEHYDDVTRSGVPGNFEAEFDHEPALSLELEGRYMAPNTLGVIFGLTYDFERDFDGGAVAGNGIVIPISSSNPSEIQTTVIYANLAYQLDRFYIPFGINYSSFDYTPTPSFTGTAMLEGDIGLQFGFGFYATNNIVFESMYRILATEYRETENNITTNYGDGTFKTLQLTLKYIF